VARSFDDPRVRYVRNEPNLGHLRNYNKGIELAAGDYVWLVSADDRLRSPLVLERYLRVMEAQPQVGFAFCPGFGLRDDQETEVVSWSTLDRPDAILNGRVFLSRLLESNCVVAPAGMVRKSCYDRLGGFPLDLPFAGDWYLWCLFALHYDVAYFAEPMVNYREHGQSMTDLLITDDLRRLSDDDFAVRWRLKAMIDAVGDAALAQHCTETIIGYYVHVLSGKKWRGTKYQMSLEHFERSLAMHVPDSAERDQVRSAVLARVGRELHWDPDLELDLRLYQLALEHGPSDVKLWLKYTLLRFGRLGALAMSAASTLRGPKRRRQPRGVQP
jgi:glycosyltransferase involved in cell wall biosynthesis